MRLHRVRRPIPNLDQRPDVAIPKRIVRHETTGELILPRITPSQRGHKRIPTSPRRIPRYQRAGAPNGSDQNRNLPAQRMTRESIDFRRDQNRQRNRRVQCAGRTFADGGVRRTCLRPDTRVSDPVFPGCRDRATDCRYVARDDGSHVAPVDDAAGWCGVVGRG